MRATKSMLERRIALINNMLGLPNEPYQPDRDANGGLVTNAGVYYLGGAYGGYRLERMCEGGGATDISPRLPKGQLADWINAYINGIEVGLNQ